MVMKLVGNKVLVSYKEHDVINEILFNSIHEAILYMRSR